MYLDNIFAQGHLGRPSAKKMEKPISFSCKAPDAQQVHLVGDFNQWNAIRNPMTRQPDGGWITQVSLPHGHHRYLFVVDESLVLDPRSNGVTYLNDDMKVSLVSVS